MIDIIVPVFDGVEETRQCLDSVLRAVQRSAVELVVVDDATPRAEIARYLDGLAHGGKITLLRNPANEGFVRSVNRGTALHPGRDVILLNSDTEVANDWADRLAAAAYSANDIATVTPFSNNATICSYPYEGWTEAMPGTLGVDGLDRVVSEANRGRRADIPTAVGFCMFIRRECLERVGSFDADRFGRGYGEENDFCMRAAKAGWRNVLAADVFVFHHGAVSFSQERNAMMDAARATLCGLHPDYPRIVQEFIDRDPIADLRGAIDRARAARGAAEAEAVLRERAMERHGLLARKHEIEAEREELRRGLAEATAIVAERSARLAERERALDERDAEIAKLHAGLAHAESLAFERADELERIRRLPLWRLYQRLLKSNPDKTPTDG